MSEFVVDIGVPGVGSLAKAIWREQAREIQAMGQWRRAWYPQAPVYPVVLKPGAILMPWASWNAWGRRRDRGDADDGLHTDAGHPGDLVSAGMLLHHGGALVMTHDALGKSSNLTIRRLAAAIITAQSREFLQLRGMLRSNGLNKPEDH